MKIIKSIMIYLREFFISFLSRKFLITMLVTVPWTILILRGKYEAAEKFNNVIIAVVVGYLGVAIAEKLPMFNGNRSKNKDVKPTSIQNSIDSRNEE